MIFTQGGITAGWGFYLQKGKLVGVHNYIGFDRWGVVSTESVPTGKVTLTFDFKYDGGGMGEGSTDRAARKWQKKSAKASWRRQRRSNAFALRGTGHRAGRRLTCRFHIHAAVSVYGPVAQSHRRAEVRGFSASSWIKLPNKKQVPESERRKNYDMPSRFFRDFGWAAVLAVFLERALPANLSAQTKRPNILVIFGDDIGQSQVSAYTMGLMGYRTPDMDPNRT